MLLITLHFFMTIILKLLQNATTVDFHCQRYFNFHINSAVEVHISNITLGVCRGEVGGVTLILETASSACSMRVALVGWPSHASCVEPR